MDDEARLRLKLAITKSGKTAKSICEKNGWPKTYVSRVVSGQISKPDPSRLLTICRAVDVDMAFVLTGENVSVDRQQLIEDIAAAPQSLVEQVACYLKSVAKSE